MPRRRTQRGFTLVELLIVVAIIGLLASILVPNLLDAMQKAHQKRTMADIRDTGTAWMSWMTDWSGAASAGSSPKVYPFNGLSSLAYDSLHHYLRPTDNFFYAQNVPRFDSWRNPLAFWHGDPAGGRAAAAVICSPGRDGIFNACDGTDVPSRSYLSTDYDQDIVWADGYFVYWPESLK